MAVYTHISKEQFSSVIDEYDIGDLVSFQGIADGISNTNYLVQTVDDKFIATIYEDESSINNLKFYWDLMEHLAADGIPCPKPIHAIDGQILRDVNKKPFFLASFLEGKWPKNLRNEHCYEIGKIMAKMHKSSMSFEPELKNPCSVHWFKKTFSNIESQIDSILGQGRSEEIYNALELIKAKWPAGNSLPQGVIHADLFPDNVFFNGDKLTGLLDFYLSCTDFFAYDVAIALNAWVFEHGTQFNITKAKQLLRGYNQIKPFTEAELQALPILCAGAAIRFLFARLQDAIRPIEDSTVVTLKDPNEYLKKLRFHLHVKNHREYGL